MTDESVLERLDVIREALRTVPSVMLVGASGLLSIVIFARLLSQAQVGLYSVGLSIVMLVNALAIGIGLAVKKRASEDNEETPFYLSSGLLLLGVWLAVAIAALIGSTPILQTYTEFTETQIFALAFFVVWHCVFTLVREYISGVGYPGKAEIGAVFRAVLMLVAQVALITLLPYGVTGLFVGGGLGYCLGTLGLLVFGAWNDVITRQLPSRETIQDVLAFSKWSIIDQSVSTSYRWFDTVVVFIVGSAAASGQFKVIYTVVTGAVMFANGIRKPAYVKLSNRHSNDKSIVPIASKIAGYISWAAIGALFGVAVLGEEILYYVFGAAYAQGGHALILLGFFMVFFTQRIGFEMFYYVQDKPRMSMRMNLLVVITFLSLLSIQYVLGIATQYPIISVAGTLLASEIVRYVAYVLMIHSETGEWFTSRIMIENFVSGSVMGVVLYLLKDSVGVPTVFHLVGMIGGGLFVYVLVEYLVFGRSLETVRNDIA